MQEHRAHPRSDLCAEATIVIDKATASVRCRISNLSIGGASLELPTTIDLPNRFTLAFDHVERACLVVWRNKTQLGVMFRGPVGNGRAPAR
jgi:hypothetical protein